MSALIKVDYFVSGACLRSVRFSDKRSDPDLWLVGEARRAWPDGITCSPWWSYTSGNSTVGIASAVCRSHKGGGHRAAQLVDQFHPSQSAVIARNLTNMAWFCALRLETLQIICRRTPTCSCAIYSYIVLPYWVTLKQSRYPGIN